MTVGYLKLFNWKKNLFRGTGGDTWTIFVALSSYIYTPVVELLDQCYFFVISPILLDQCYFVDTSTIFNDVSQNIYESLAK